MRTASLYDSGREVAQLQIQRSLRPLLVSTGVFALLGLALGVAVFVSLRILPLRALRRALAAAGVGLEVGDA